MYWSRWGKTKQGGRGVGCVWLGDQGALIRHGCDQTCTGTVRAKPLSSICLSLGQWLYLPGVWSCHRSIANPQRIIKESQRAGRWAGRRPQKCSVKQDWDSLSISDWCKPAGTPTSLHIKHISAAYTSHSLTAFSGRGPRRARRLPSANTEKSQLVSEGGGPTPKTTAWHFFTEPSKSPEATCSQSRLIYTEPQISIPR